MSKEKREEQVKVINSLLELKRKVVGVKFYYDEEESVRSARGYSRWQC